MLACSFPLSSPGAASFVLASDDEFHSERVNDEGGGRMKARDDALLPTCSISEFVRP